MSQNFINLDTQKLISKVLNNIPTHRESPKSVEEIVSSVIATVDISHETALALTVSTLAFLDLFDVLNWCNNSCQIKAQIPYYFLNSLDWYLVNHQKLLSNWERKGTAREIKVTNMLEMAPYFLKMMEQRRLELSEREGISAGHSRFQSVALILIKGLEKGEIYFLHQWDTAAEQYQLIGGRQRPNESHFETAKRELHEEIIRHDLVYGRDYELTLLSNPSQPIKALEISRTFGALTAYEFWIYGVKFKFDQLRLSEIDRWISIDEMKKGITNRGSSISDPKLYRFFDASLPSGIEGVPLSINVSQTENYLDFIEMKPKLFGFLTIDIKGIFLHWRQKCKEKSNGT